MARPAMLMKSMKIGRSAAPVKDRGARAPEPEAPTLAACVQYIFTLSSLFGYT